MEYVFRCFNSKKWWKSFVKVVCVYFFDVVKLRMYVTSVVFGTEHVYWKDPFPFW